MVSINFVVSEEEQTTTDILSVDGGVDTFNALSNDEKAKSLALQGIDLNIDDFTETVGEETVSTFKITSRDEQGRLTLEDPHLEFDPLDYLIFDNLLSYSLLIF